MTDVPGLESTACHQSSAVNVEILSALPGKAVPVNKCNQRGRGDGDEEVRWVIVLVKRGNARGGRTLGEVNLKGTRCGYDRDPSNNGNKTCEDSEAIGKTTGSSGLTA